MPDKLTTVIYRFSGFPVVHFNIGDGTAAVCDAGIVTIRGVPKHSEQLARQLIDIAKATRANSGEPTQKNLWTDFE